MKAAVFAKIANTTPKVLIVTNASQHTTDRTANNGTKLMSVMNVIATTFTLPEIVLKARESANVKKNSDLQIATPVAKVIMDIPNVNLAIVSWTGLKIGNVKQKMGCAFASLISVETTVESALTSIIIFLSANVRIFFYKNIFIYKKTFIYKRHSFIKNIYFMINK